MPIVAERQSWKDWGDRMKSARAFPSLADVIVIAGPPRLQPRRTDS